MSKITWSGIGITAGNGKVGQKVASRNRGGDVLRAYVIPVYPNTPNQQVFANAYRALTGLWQTISQGMRDAWNEAALTTYRKNQLGHKYRLSGFNLFVSQTFNIFIGNGTPALLPVPPGKVIGVKSVQINSLSSAQIRITITFTDGNQICPANQACAVFASDSVSQGINYKRTGYNAFFAFNAGDNTLAVDVFPQYLLLYPAPTPGDKIFFRFKCYQGNTGQATPYFYIAGIVS